MSSFKAQSYIDKRKIERSSRRKGKRKNEKERENVRLGESLCLERKKRWKKNEAVDQG